jgi:hypothetical protein
MEPQEDGCRIGVSNNEILIRRLDFAPDGFFVGSMASAAAEKALTSRS